MAQPKITVFTTNHCPSCLSLKRWLSDQGIAFETVNLEENPERQADIFAKSGRFEVPITLVTYDSGAERVINGPRYGEIKQALQAS